MHDDGDEEDLRTSMSAKLLPQSPSLRAGGSSSEGGVWGIDLEIFGFCYKITQICAQNIFFEVCVR